MSKEKKEEKKEEEKKPIKFHLEEDKKFIDDSELIEAKQEKDKSIARILQEGKLETDVVENILLQLNQKYKTQIEQYKEDYHKYQQSGRYFTSTKVRKVKKRDFACFINFETDLMLIERIRLSDGVNLQTATYEYPIVLTRSIEIKLLPFNLQRKFVIHLCVANISSLEISNHIKNLASSVFLRNILKYRDRKALDKPLTQIIIGSLLLGVVFYFMLIRVFQKAILRIIGDLTLTPPAT